MGTLSGYFQTHPMWLPAGVVVGGGSTECKGNQVPEKNVFCPCEPEGGGLGKHTDGVMQRRMLGFPSPTVGV